jgi:hypothetical protein
MIERDRLPPEGEWKSRVLLSMPMTAVRLNDSDSQTQVANGQAEKLMEILISKYHLHPIVDHFTIALLATWEATWLQRSTSNAANSSGTIRSIKEPQGVYYIARSYKLAVASGGDGKVSYLRPGFEALGQRQFAG